MADKKQKDENKKMEERKFKLLKQLEAFFKEDETVEEASLFTKEELETPMDIVRALLTDYGPGLMDVLAEYSFIPFEGPQEVWYFSSIITIKMDVPKDGVSALCGAISRLNFYLPYGAFCINAAGDLLIYKSVTAIRTDHNDKEIYENMELSADTALLVAEEHTDMLVKVANGTMLLDDFIDTLPQ